MGEEIVEEIGIDDPSLPMGSALIFKKKKRICKHDLRMKYKNEICELDSFLFSQKISSYFFLF